MIVLKNIFDTLQLDKNFQGSYAEFSERYPDAATLVNSIHTLQVEHELNGD